MNILNDSVDVLLASYNGENYLASQIQSLLEQTHTNCRIIIRDDVSTDGSAGIIEKFQAQYPDKIVFFRGEKNLGAVMNFATLTTYPTAPYVMFCDCDDVWMRSKVEESLLLMKKNEHKYGKEVPLLVHTDLTVVDKQLHVIHPSFWMYSKMSPSSANSISRLLAHNVITGCTMMINRALLEAATPIPEDVIMHDWWIGLVAASVGYIDFLNKPTILYRQHGKNEVGAKDWRSWKTYWMYAKKVCSQKGKKEIKHRIEKTIQQSLLLLDMCGSMMDEIKRKKVEQYARLGGAGVFEKRMIILRNGFFKNTFPKNVGLLLFI